MTGFVREFIAFVYFTLANILVVNIAISICKLNNRVLVLDVICFHLAYLMSCTFGTSGVL